MFIKDVKGFYEIKVDKERRIVYETAFGMFTAEDYNRMCDEYYYKIVPYLGKGNWAKFCDLRQTKPSTSNSPENINRHFLKLAELGFIGGACFVDSATLKMQVNRSSKGLIEVGYFDNEKEADEWLKSIGY